MHSRFRGDLVSITAVLVVSVAFVMACIWATFRHYGDVLTIGLSKGEALRVESSNYTLEVSYGEPFTVVAPDGQKYLINSNPPTLHFDGNKYGPGEWRVEETSYFPAKFVFTSQEQILIREVQLRTPFKVIASIVVLIIAFVLFLYFAARLQKEERESVGAK